MSLVVPAMLARSGVWHIQVLNVWLLGAFLTPGMHRGSRQQVGFVEKLVLRAKDELAVFAGQAEVEAWEDRDLENLWEILK